MKILVSSTCLMVLIMTLSACGGTDTKETTVVHDRPVIVAPASPSVESTCDHGYDNRSHSCY